ITSALDPFLSPSGARHAAAATIASSPPPQAPSPAKIAGAYAPITALILGFVYAVMIGFGLPDWVFPAGVVLMILGLPALLFAAYNERNPGKLAWFTFRRAIWGGVISISGLSLVTAGFMIMRIMGIGPAATLQSAGILEENAKLLVAEFENQTQDETLGSSVTELLKIDLSQSGAISLMDGADIVGVLSRMNLPPDTRIDLNTAMEIAARDGAEAVIAGEIRQIGAGFSISARLLSAIDGSELEAFRVTADDDTKIISAIDGLSGNVREKIGESIKTIRANEDLDRVTTGSLDALRLYSQGVAAEDAGDHNRSIELLNQAVELDSTFAMAYRKLAVVYGNSDSSPEYEIAAATKAYELINRLPDREKGLSTAYYYAVVDRDRNLSVAAYEAILESYPDDTPALNNVSIEYNLRGEFAKAERNLRRAIELSDRNVFYFNLLNSLSAQKKWDEADEYMARFVETNPTHPSQASMAFMLAVARGDYENADTLIGSASFNSDPYWQLTDAGNRADYYIYRGQLKAVEDQVRRANALNAERGNLSEVLEWSLGDAHIRIDLLGDLEGARQKMEEALARVPLDSLRVEARPYTNLITLHARLGDVDGARALRDEYERLVPERLRKGNLGRFQADAEILLAEGRLEEALETMQLSQSVDRCNACFYDKQARVLERMGSLEAALQLLEEFVDFSMAGPFWYLAPRQPIANLRLGELHARLGNIDKAIEAYTKFVNLWIEADDELQPQVQHSRDQIERLLDQSVREKQ
ncbi:MAG: tetratricopeptide repeat protein, partial [Bacteroidetes bacterium]|nr:tetratricopeptide repeat protein [Bacteroidota bacterium]